MRTVLLPFFVIRLGLSVAPFFLGLVADALKAKIGLIAITTMAIGYAVIFFQHLTAYTTADVFSPPPTPHPATALKPLFTKIVADQPHYTLDLTPQALAAAEQTVKTASGSAQPHRDLLINEYFLAISQSNPTRANHILEQLRYIDPNHPMVQELQNLQ